jgi:tRNA 2-thiouridine synthesizing protein A
MNSPGGAASGPSLQPDSVLDMTQIPAAQGAICAVLTPAIRARLREMASGQVLEIRVDPTAREDIASWCRLTGHELVAEFEEPQLLRMFVRKKQS